MSDGLVRSTSRSPLRGLRAEEYPFQAARTAFRGHLSVGATPSGDVHVALDDAMQSLTYGDAVWLAGALLTAAEAGQDAYEALQHKCVED